jgi:hypothetical protein
MARLLVVTGVLLCIVTFQTSSVRAEGSGAPCTQISAPIYEGDITLSCICGDPSEPWLYGSNGCSAKGVLAIYWTCDVNFPCGSGNGVCSGDPDSTSLRTVMVIPNCKSTYGQQCGSASDCGFWGDTRTVRMQIHNCTCH